MAPPPSRSKTENSLAKRLDLRLFDAWDIISRQGAANASHDGLSATEPWTVESRYADLQLTQEQHCGGYNFRNGIQQRSSLTCATALRDGYPKTHGNALQLACATAQRSRQFGDDCFRISLADERYSLLKPPV